MKQLIAILLTAISIITAQAADPTATHWDASQCEGSSMPYPSPEVSPTLAPDSLTPVLINHVGRHGARFPSSARFTAALKRMLNEATDRGTITAKGKKLQQLISQVEAIVQGQWGALDSLGRAEQRAIASRMRERCQNLFADSVVIQATSSYSPRCIMSMYEFTHQLTRLNNNIEIYTSSGRQNSPTLRFFDTDSNYKEFIQSQAWHEIYDNFVATTCPVDCASDVLGAQFTTERGTLQDFALNEYKLLSGCAAIGLEADWRQFLTLEQYNALWQCANLHHYLTHSASTLSDVPAQMATPLLQQIISTTDLAILNLQNPQPSSALPTAYLRFGHAETLMPLLSLIHLPGCYYMTNYFDTVGLHWRDFNIVPMGANLQFTLYISDTGRYYLRTDLNEHPVPLIPGRNAIYTPWETARQYLGKCMGTDIL